MADSRMVNLRGRFAVILLVEGTPQAAEKIRAGANEAGKKVGLTVTVSAESAGGGARAGVPYRLKTHAMDQPGIAHRITHLLSRHNVNIEELQTRLSAGSYTGTPLFNMDMRITVPPEVAIKQLRSELEALCDTLNCDVELEPA